MSRLISVVGDSNVRRNMTSLNIASRESMKKAEVIDCSLITTLDSALIGVRPESSQCIVACITEFLLLAGECGTILSSIDPVLSTFAQKLSQFCSSRPKLQVCLNLTYLHKLVPTLVPLVDVDQTRPVLCK